MHLLMAEFAYSCPEVTLCGCQEGKIQLLILHLLLYDRGLTFFMVLIRPSLSSLSSRCDLRRLPCVLLYGPEMTFVVFGMVPR